MSARSRRPIPIIALVVALLGATVVMISPITPWTTAVAVLGLALVVPGVAVLTWWLLRNWNW
jgi:membrane-bound ClpP family serine protease